MTKTSHCIAGSITAGCFSTVIGHPLDTIKVHQQTMSAEGSLRVAKKIAKGNIFRLFKGMGPPMANQIIMNSVMFSVFHQMKDAANESAVLDENASALCAGLFSGFATACLSTPTDWIKIQAQLALSREGVGAPTNTASILKRLLEDSNYQVTKVTQTLYRGHVANLAREGVFTMVYLGLYDRISSAVKRGMNKDEHRDLHMGEVVMISSFTGACAWMCNYPFDTVKSVIQGRSVQERITMRSAVRSIFESGGLKAFYRGAGASTFRAMLVTSSRMFAYETTLQMLR